MIFEGYTTIFGYLCPVNIGGIEIPKHLICKCSHRSREKVSI